MCVGQPLHQARGQEVKGLRAALRQRTQQTSNLEAEITRLQQLEGQARSQLADGLAALTGRAILHMQQAADLNVFKYVSSAKVTV